MIFALSCTWEVSVTLDATWSVFVLWTRRHFCVTPCDPRCYQHLKRRSASPPPPLSSLHHTVSPLHLHLHPQQLLSNPLAEPHPPTACKSVPLISLWRGGEWSGGASCPLPPLPHPALPPSFLLPTPPPPPSPALALWMATLLRVEGLGSSLINEMYDNVISLIEWHSLMVLCDDD